MKVNKSQKTGLIIIFTFISASVLYFMINSLLITPPHFTENSTDIDLATSGDYVNCIILEKDNAIQMIDRKKVVIQYNNLEQILSTQIHKLKGEEVKIICTKETEYTNVIQVLDCMVKMKISRYKLLKA